MLPGNAGRGLQHGQVVGLKQDKNPNPRPYRVCLLVSTDTETQEWNEMETTPRLCDGESGLGGFAALGTWFVQPFVRRRRSIANTR